MKSQYMRIVFVAALSGCLLPPNLAVAADPASTQRPMLDNAQDLLPFYLPNPAYLRAEEQRKAGGHDNIEAAAALLLSKAYDDLKSKSWTDAISKCKEAGSLAGLSDFDKFLVNYFLGIAYYRLGDTENAAASYYTAAQFSGVPADMRTTAILSAAQLENDTKHPDKVAILVKMADTAGIADEKIYDLGAIAYYDSGNDAEARTMADKAISQATKSGRGTSRIGCRIALMAEVRQMDLAALNRTLKTMCSQFGDRKDWGDLVDAGLGSLRQGASDEESVDVAAFYMYRLRLLTDAESGSNDYLMAAKAGVDFDTPGDTYLAIRTAHKRGLLNGNVQASAMLSIADEQAAKDGRAVAEARAKDGGALVAIGERQFGYGRYADAIRLARAALSKGGGNTAHAFMLLGAAQVMNGESSAGAATLAGISGDPAMAKAAHLWLIYATQTYGQSGPSAAATPHL
ncbi:MAG: hypothetical protein WCA81_00925 [Rhizomicrobium sp.]